MKRKIRTADEEMGNVLYIVLFSTLWYVSIINTIIKTGFHTSLLIFLLAGLLPLMQTAHTIRKTLYYRRLHEQCVRESRPERGRIINITREYSDEYNGNHRRRSTYY